MNIYLWTAEILLGLIWIYSLYAISNPERTLKFTIERTIKTMKFYKIKATMKPTKRSAEILRNGHILVLLLATIYMIIVYLYGDAFMVQFIR